MKRCYCKGALCGNAEILDGGRVLHLDARMDWGTTDLRVTWNGSYDFGSFACAALWAQDRAKDHDGHVLTEGAA